MHAELPSYGPRAALTQADRIDAYLRVLNALMLRDMRARLFGSYWGWLAWTLWPVAHMLIISVAMVFRKTPPPFGDSIMVFAATGAIPALAFSYISSEIMKSVMRNKALTYYPQVRSLDIVFAAAMVEAVDNFLAVMLICIILLLCGIDPMPIDLTASILGYICAIMLGLAMGTVNAAIVQVFPGWALGYVIVRLAMYFASGVVFPVQSLPRQVYDMLRWNPLLQIVEWVRNGYNPTGAVPIDYLYVISWIVCLVAVGLGLERTVARRYAA